MTLVIAGLLCLIFFGSNAQNTIKSLNTELKADTSVAMEIGIDTTEKNNTIERTSINVQNYHEDSLGPVYTVVQEAPHFPGGQSAYYTFLEKNFKYPPSAIDNEVQGVVWVFFVVEKDGSITHAHIIPGKGLDKYCDAEVLRIVNMMPKWIPGKNYGEPIRTKHKLGVTFVLEDGSVKNKKTK